MNYTDDLTKIANLNSNGNNKIVDIFYGHRPKVTVTQCPRITAMELAQDHNMTLQFCEKCVHANIGGASATVKYSHTIDDKTALVMVVNECLDKYKSLTNK